MGLEILVFVTAAALMAVVELLAIAGLLGVLANERIERCGRCGRAGLTEGGERHPHGCPEGHFSHLHGHLHVPGYLSHH